MGNLTRAFEAYERSERIREAIRVASQPLNTFCADKIHVAVMPLRARALVSAEPGSLDEARVLCEYGIQIYHVKHDAATSDSYFARAAETAERE